LEGALGAGYREIFGGKEDEAKITRQNIRRRRDYFNNGSLRGEEVEIQGDQMI